MPTELDENSGDASAVISEPLADEEAPKQGALGHLSADEELQQAVCSALIETPELDTSDVAVAAANARVTLSGSVATMADKKLALRIAKSHSGVRAVDAVALNVRQV
jgi:osmotically-inducible protein OsmY